MRVLLSQYGSRGYAEPLAPLHAGTPAAYEGLSSGRVPKNPPQHAQATNAAPRAQGHRVRVGRDWATTTRIDDQDNPGPDALLRALIASGLRSELMT
ncbi:hypothetical protein [Streptomyces zagrosensis]|uniref:Uncharacterized protein n=1 Tax=Streptomyces zagrosensis TaxID=1042984 RepID=A0A7W9V3A4_9ACTN|nr:hypothetical protein [Streptomyces zagrosensis]MBB5940096.1 hypothetical protein [Streptomyces zagrosensis]